MSGEWIRGVEGTVIDFRPWEKVEGSRFKKDRDAGWRGWKGGWSVWPDYSLLFPTEKRQPGPSLVVQW